MSSRFLSALALTLGMLSPRAAAHAPVELLQIVSTQPGNVVLSTNRGLIFGDLTNRTWSLLCNEAFDTRTTEHYGVALLPSGRLLIGSNGGLRFSDDRGCSWHDVPSNAHASVSALAQHPSDPQRLYLATYGAGQGALRTTADGAETIEPLLLLPDTEYVTALLVGPGEPVQLYASTTGFPATPEEPLHHYLLRSSDAGRTWHRTEVPLTSDERDLTLLALNPAQPEELLARASSAEPARGERLLWSRDGGYTFSSPALLHALRSAAFSRDGALAYAGDKDGVWRAADAQRSFAHVPMTTRISHVQAQESAVLASGYYAGLEALADGIGIAPLSESPSFQHWMSFDEVTSHIQCPAPSVVESKCAALWRDWQLENPRFDPAAGAPDVPVVDDTSDLQVLDGAYEGGTSADAASPMDAGAYAPARTGGGCGLGASAPHPSALLVLAGAAWRRRRRYRPR